MNMSNTDKFNVNEEDFREEIIKYNWLRGAISMPSNIFARTGTSVAILFIDKTRTDSDEIFLMNASKIGKKVTLEDGQRTILSQEEQKFITNTFKKKEIREEFSISVKKDEVKKKNYSFFAGNYFSTKIIYSEKTNEDFEQELLGIDTELDALFSDGEELNQKIRKMMKEINYDQSKRV